MHIPTLRFLVYDPGGPNPAGLLTGMRISLAGNLLHATENVNGNITDFARVVAKNWQKGTYKESMNCLADLAIMEYKYSSRATYYGVGNGSEDIPEVSEMVEQWKKITGRLMGGTVVFHPSSGHYVLEIGHE